MLLAYHNVIYRGPSTNIEPDVETDSVSQTAAPALGDRPLKKALSQASAEVPLAHMIQTKVTPSNMRYTYDLLEGYDDEVYAGHVGRTVQHLLPAKVISCQGTERKKRMLSMTAVAATHSDIHLVHAVPRSEQLLFLFTVLLLDEDDTVCNWAKTCPDLNLDYDASFKADIDARKLTATQLRIHSMAAFLYLFGYNVEVIQKSVTKSLSNDLETETTRGDIDESVQVATQDLCNKVIAEVAAIDSLLTDSAKTSGSTSKWRPLRLGEICTFLRDCVGVTEIDPYCPTRFLKDYLVQPCSFDPVWGMPDDKNGFTAVTFPIGGVRQIRHLRLQAYYENCLFVGDAQYRAVTPLVLYGLVNLGADKIGSP
eukprot:SAG31_NODE_8861_length_1373_cov_0.980377_1_plen_367_part_01